MDGDVDGSMALPFLVVSEPHDTSLGYAILTHVQRQDGGNMSDRSHLRISMTIIKMVMRLTPLSAALDIAQDAEEFVAPKGMEGLLTFSKRSLDSVAASYQDIAPEDRGAVESQLADMLNACDLDEVLSHALDGPDHLESWLVEQRLVNIPRFLGEAENYFRDLLTIFCHLTASAAFDPKRPHTHVALAVSRQGSRLNEIEVALGELQVVVAQLQAQFVGPCSDPSLAISSDDWAELAAFQARAVDDVRPEVLPEHPRLPELEAAVPGGLRFPLLIVGEGGIGKSVLAGQLIKAARDKNSPALMVLCNRIGVTADISSVEALDLALGKAASQVDKDISLSSWLTQWTPTEYRPLVVIDTLDLLLREDTADSIQTLLTQLSSLTNLAVTCRRIEWDDLISEKGLRSWPTWVIPFLTQRRILDWAMSFTDATHLSPPTAAAFLDSLEQSLVRHRGANVFGSPLRLRMACDLYAATGALPEHLTVSDLYADYWNQRVARDRRGRRTQTGQDQEQAATQLSETIWTHSGSRFVEHVPPPPSISAEQRLLLRSEGVVHDLGGRYGFFHQTFAEFAVARYLAVHALATDLTVLGEGLRESRAGYWGVAIHLFRQPMDMERLREIVDAIPSDRVTGLKLKITTAAAQEDQSLLIDLIDDALANNPVVLASCVDALEEAPAESVARLASRLTTLIERTPSNLTATVRSTAVLIDRAPESHRTDCFVRAATALMRRTEDLSASKVWSETRRFIDGTAGVHPHSYPLDALLMVYRLLPGPGRAALLEALVARQEEGSQLAETLETLFSYPYPSNDYRAGTTLLLRTLEDEVACSRLGWVSWTDMGRLRLEAPWDSCQVRAMAEGAAEPRALCDLLGLLQDETSAVDTDRLLNTALFVANDHPQQVVDHLLEMANPRSAQTASSFAQIARHARLPFADGAASLTRAQVERLAVRLSEIASLNPRKVWPALVAVASQDPGLLAQYLDLLTRAHELGEVDSATTRAVMEALFLYALPRDVQALEGRLREVLSTQNQTVRVGFDAWLAAESSDARSRVEAVFTNPSAHGPANAAAKRISTWLLSASSASKTQWAVTLLQTPHGHALRLLLDGIRPGLQSGYPI